jgi:hypothetical protein
MCSNLSIYLRCAALVVLVGCCGPVRGLRVGATYSRWTSGVNRVIIELEDTKIGHHGLIGKPAGVTAYIGGRHAALGKCLVGTVEVLRGNCCRVIVRPDLASREKLRSLRADRLYIRLVDTGMMYACDLEVGRLDESEFWDAVVSGN